MTESATLPTLVIIVGGLGVAGLVAYLMVQRERRRLENLIAWAATMGYSLAAGSRSLANAGLHTSLTSLPVFSRGSFPRVRYVVRGQTPDGELVLFDFRYTTQAGKHTTTIEQTIAAFGLKDTRVPSFELWPEGFLSKLGQAFGMADINFDGNPEFSRHYRLRGPDRDAVRRLFEPQAARLLSDTTGWSSQGADNWVIFFRDGRRQRPQEVPAFLDTARAVLTAIVAGR